MINYKELDKELKACDKSVLFVVLTISIMVFVERFLIWFIDRKGILGIIGWVKVFSFLLKL